MSLSFKKRIKSRKYLPSLGSTIKPPSIEIATKYGILDFEWLLVDINLASLQTIEKIVSMLKHKKDLIIKTPHQDISAIKNILKADIDGILISQLKTPEEAYLATELCQKLISDEQTIILEIEHSLYDFLQVGGFDSILINPYNFDKLDVPGVEQNFPKSSSWSKFQEILTKLDTDCFEWGINLGIITNDFRYFFEAEECSTLFICLDMDSVDFSTSILNNVLERRNKPYILPSED